MAIDKARICAVNGLIKIESSGYSNLVLSSVINANDLDNTQKAFMTKIFYGTIERKITIDYILQKFIQKPLKKLDKEVLSILRSGLYQIRYMDKVPESAAVNQAVNLASYFKKSSAKGMINAVLRKCINFDIENENFKNEDEALSVLYSVNLDIVKLLKTQYPNEYKQIIKSFFKTPILHININLLKISKDEYTHLLDKEGIVWKDTQIDNCIEVEVKNSITKLVGFDEGYFFVQGFCSVFSVYSAQIKEDMKVLDLCAAPGGKSFASSIFLNNTGSITSLDPNENRLTLIDNSAQRLGINNITTGVNRGEVYNENLKDFDVVIADVPCSGLGIIPKKPDLRYKDLSDINSLTQLQYEILATASKYVKEKGVIIYSTCTLNKDENEEVVKKFLNENSNFKLENPTLVPQNAVINEKMITFLPNFTEYDGFFVAIIRKV